MTGTAQQSVTESGGLAGLDRAFVAAVEAASSINTLQELVQTVVVSMLRRADDQPLRGRTLATVAAYFTRMRGLEGMSPRDKLSHLRLFARETIQIVLSQRPYVGGGDRPVTAAAATPGRRASDHATAAPPPAAGMTEADCAAMSTADGESPLAIHQPAPPRPQKFATFKELFSAALRYRLCGVTRFFQRGNGTVRRELVRPFLLAPEFEARFLDVVDTVIVPKMFAASRQLATLDASRRWDEISTAGFWDLVAEDDRLRAIVVTAWEEAWATCRQRETLRKVHGHTKTVLVAQPELKHIREMLTPDHGGLYDIPTIRNGEIDLFVSLLTEFDIDRLEQCFTKLRQLYEQEMDRRSHQDPARAGALRDSLLDAVESFPDRSGDFLALLCYYCFPNTDLFFLERFTHNKGANHAARVQRLPYLMRFLGGEQVPRMRERERRERREREAAAKAEAERTAAMALLSA